MKLVRQLVAQLEELVVGQQPWFREFLHHPPRFTVSIGGARLQRERAVASAIGPQTMRVRADAAPRLASRASRPTCSMRACSRTEWCSSRARATGTPSRLSLGAAPVTSPPRESPSCRWAVLATFRGCSRSIVACRARGSMTSARSVTSCARSTAPTVEALERTGFYACTLDLEDELTRAVGPAGMERVLAEQGELRAFRTRKATRTSRAAARGAAARLQARKSRKQRYAVVLVEALDLERVPPARPRPRAVLGPRGEPPRSQWHHRRVC